MSRKLGLWVMLGCAASGAALTSSGCGASSVRSTVDPVARAADVTGAAPGYKISMTQTTSSPATGPVMATGTGVIDRADKAGSMNLNLTVSGHQLTMQAVFSNFNVFMRLPAIGQLRSVTGGKPWMSIDFGRAGSAMGMSLSSLAGAGSSDPSQFLNYLKAASASTTRVGTDTVRGVATTHYHAIVDLDRYPSRVPASERSAATKTVTVLEKLTGAHTIPMDVWIDAQRLVRRQHFMMSECLPGQPGKTGMDVTMEMYDYGPQARPKIPAASDVFDATPLVTAAIGQLKFGC